MAPRYGATRVSTVSDTLGLPRMLRTFFESRPTCTWILSPSASNQIGEPSGFPAASTVQSTPTSGAASSSPSSFFVNVPGIASVLLFRAGEDPNPRRPSGHVTHDCSRVVASAQCGCGPNHLDCGRRRVGRFAENPADLGGRHGFGNSIGEREHDIARLERPRVAFGLVTARQPDHIANEVARR